MLVFSNGDILATGYQLEKISLSWSDIFQSQDIDIDVQIAIIFSMQPWYFCRFDTSQYIYRARSQ